MDIRRMSYDRVKRLVGKKVTIANHGYFESKPVETIKKIVFGTKIGFELSNGSVIDPINVEIKEK